ncbi:MAG: 2-C-methyl-D-erythritol 2,4-cyclodiphosphate synthase [Nitrospirae bacterium]|nr:2-C-methyl-D-erythritol 2,4-cyclodiphosphate synthase [Nitrospirota bacterium]MCL5421427.1 2-C-methyl-D-erythritol 2,4-cyclodiphosphate synthase [Nitrospirota bacterium]
MRIGVGYDSHRLVAGRKLILGGVGIPFSRGLLGHSDGDVLCHAIIDAVIGALGIGDIGRHFPDSDPRWKDASSLEMLKYIVELAHANGYEVTWIDSIVMAEKPKLAPYMESMKETIAKACIAPGSISIKAKTDEGMGFVGREEGMAAYAVCLLRKRS